MELYLVSKKSQEESVTGVIEVAETTVYGVYTTRTRADNIADKYDADVTVFVADKETRVAIQRWTNPGYVENGS